MFQKKLELHKVERRRMTQIIQQLHQSKQNVIIVNIKHQNHIVPITRRGNTKGMQAAVPVFCEIEKGFIVLRAYRLVGHHLRRR